MYVENNNNNNISDNNKGWIATEKNWKAVPRTELDGKCLWDVYAHPLRVTGLSK